MAKNLKTLLVTLMLIIGISASAQVTTSAISGSVLNEANEPVIGATVIAVHQPSGTRYGAVTNLDGRYTIQGMRTGGPYEVTISYIGYKKASFTNEFLELGNTANLSATLEPSTNELDEVVIVAKGTKQEAGASRNFSLKNVELAPTVDRNIYDVVKNMPMATTNKIGGLSFAGSNNRYNSFQIDGTVSNDVFGLSSSGTNGGQSGANPIPMDAIQEIQVVVAPFDVRQSGFTGGGINAITKQGTNTFHGSLYGYYTNENLYGKYNAAKEFAKDPLGKQHTTTFGGTFSGPIVKDKLFFFVNVDNKNESYPSTYYPGYTDKYITEADAQKLIDAYKKFTGITESYAPRDIVQKQLSILGRIDWNINQNNKLALRYQYNNSSDDKFGNGSSTFTFSNSSYKMNNKMNSFVLELNSHLNDSWYNELRGSATFVRDNRDVAYQGPTVYISGITPKVNLGTEYSSGANSLDQDVYTFEDNLSWYNGSHTWTFGTHNEFFRIKNVFVQANNGEWVYNTIEDFLNDATPYQFVYKFVDSKYQVPVLNAAQFGMYVQDKWEPSRNFQLTYGLRVDVPVIFSRPTANVEFNQFADSHNLGGVRVGVEPSTKWMLSPRVGFRWWMNDSHKTLLRGGVGLFTGRVPFVWISNAYNNTGIEIKGTTITTKGNVKAPTFGEYFNDPQGAMNSQKGSFYPDIVTIDPKFQFPQVFRANLGLEQMLPGDVKFTMEGLFSKTLNNAYFTNLALVEKGKVYAIPGVEASAAPLYSVSRGNYNTIINTSNSNKGYTYSVSAALEKNFAFGLNAFASYTFGHSKSIFDGTSSVASSNWKYNYAVDTNNPELSWSIFDQPHHVVVSLGYTTPKYLYGVMQSTLSVIYNGSTGMRYSLTMNEKADFNGDGQKGNSLLYIPTADELNKMNFVSEDARKSFGEWIEGDSYAKNHRGQFAERNSNMAPWENRVDLHFAQDFFLLRSIPGSKLQFTFDVINFANMLNKEWGVSYSSAYNVTPLTVEANKVAGRTDSYQYDFNSKSTAPTEAPIFSRWHAQLGLKLVF